jgi:hypothetical protein
MAAQSAGMSCSICWGVEFRVVTCDKTLFRGIMFGGIMFGGIMLAVGYFPIYLSYLTAKWPNDQTIKSCLNTQDR